MFMIRIWNYFRGYAIIIVEGLKIERFINLAVLNGIYIWDIKRKNYTTVEAKVGLENFMRLRDITKKTDSNIHVIKKCGFPFFIQNMKKRKILYIGLLLLIFFISFISSKIWMIEVSGNKSVEAQKIVEQLGKIGLVEGISKHKINKAKIENSMLINMPELSWLGVEIKGTKAVVSVIEKRKEPVIVDITEACDIVAAKDGLITKVLSLKGDPTVKDGDTVKRGQTLVTGTILRENMDVRYVHSMAQVMARTWYEDAEEIPLSQIEYQKTGNNDIRYKLILLNKEFSLNPFKKVKTQYKDFNEFVEKKNVLCFGDFVFPVKLIKTRYEELKPILKVVTAADAKKRCTERLNSRIMLQLPENAVVLNKKIDFYVDSKTVKAKISVEALEDIALKQKINN